MPINASLQRTPGIFGFILGYMWHCALPALCKMYEVTLNWPRYFTRHNNDIFRISKIPLPLSPPLWFFSGSMPPRTYEIPCDNYRRGLKLTPVTIKCRLFGMQRINSVGLRFGINTINTYSRHTSVIPWLTVAKLSGNLISLKHCWKSSESRQLSEGS